MGWSSFLRAIGALLLACLLLAACREKAEIVQIAVNATAVLTPDNPVTQTATPLPGATGSSLPTFQLSTPDPSSDGESIDSFAMESAPVMVEGCIGPKEVNIEELLLGENHSLILSQPRAGHGRPPILGVHYGGAISASTVLNEVNYNRPELSPNGTWLAYTWWDEGDKQKLMLVAVDHGEETVLLEDLPDNFSHFSWVDDDQLVIWDGTPWAPNTDKLRPTHFVNVTTGEIIESPEIPASIHLASVTRFGPMGEFVVFISGDTLYWTIYHFQTGDFKILTGAHYLTEPTWAPHTPTLAIFSDDLHIFSFEEGVSQKSLGLPYPVEGAYIVTMAAWDNSGQKLAFYAQHWNEMASYFAIPEGIYVYDGQVNEINYYCNEWQRQISNSDDLHWSPNGRFVGWTTASTLPKVIILEVGSGRYTSLDNAKLLGWGPSGDK
jgi:hypothetical protein